MKTKGSITLFCDLVKDAKGYKDLKFAKNDYLFKEEERPEGIYHITKGKVKILKHNNVEYPVILHIAKEGEQLGVQAVIDDTTHWNSAIAMDEVEVCFVPAEEFLRIINNDNALKLQIMQSLCTRINRIENQISSRSEKSANQRFAELLTFLANDYGLSEDKMLNIDLTLDELASLAGTSRNYLAKIISDFSNNGWIQAEEGRFKILQMPRLLETAKQ